jgi:heme-degrading monooxygenase HmoA
VRADDREGTLPGHRGQYILRTWLTFSPNGSGGVWSKLFARCPGFRGTTLLRDTKNTRRYLTIDMWDTAAQREQILAERKAEYANLDDAFADWTESKTEVGIFRVQAEATVHPRGRARRSKAGDARRRSR